MDKFPTRKPIRLKKYDYSTTGYYYVTICTRNRENIFGKHKNTVGAPLACARNQNTCARIELSIIGEIINRQWNDIKNQYDNVELDQYIIMPNHIHSILIINKREGASPSPTIPQIIRSFKSKSALEYVKYINDNNLNISGKIWQRSFYDHIIRNDKSLQEIREYISNNPLKWDDDENNIKNNKLTGQACLPPTQ
ncbi:transposase [bacterium]|nr:transposase [bacterium]